MWKTFRNIFAFIVFFTLVPIVWVGLKIVGRAPEGSEYGHYF